MKPLVTITIEDERLDDLEALGEEDAIAAYKEMIDHGLVDLSADIRNGKVKLVSLKASQSSTPDSVVLQWPSPTIKAMRAAAVLVAGIASMVPASSWALELANYLTLIDLFSS